MTKKQMKEEILDWIDGSDMGECIRDIENYEDDEFEEMVEDKSCYTPYELEYAIFLRKTDEDGNMPNMDNLVNQVYDYAGGTRGDYGSLKTCVDDVIRDNLSNIKAKRTQKN